MNSFLVTNNLGGYLWYSKEPFSRYQGWFMPFQDRMIKIIDSIEGNFNSLYFPKYYKSLIVTSNSGNKIKIIFDIRESYQIPEWGRRYHIFEKGGIIWVKYSLERVIIGLKVQGRCRMVGKWRQQFYPFDKKRQSPPFSLWVYEGLEVIGRRVAIAADENENEVVKELQKASSFRVKKSPAYVKLKNGKQSIALAFHLAKHSLLSLRVYEDEKKLLGLYAGLPWFFQFWLRDEAISLKALFWLLPKEARELALLRKRHLKEHTSPAYLGLNKGQSKLASVDGPLWIYLRLSQLGLKQYISVPSDSGFIVNGPKETWMDTIPRKGARIEVQTLKLALLKGSPLEHEFCQKVRKYFWDGITLADGIEPDGSIDKTIRPHAFLSYYLYPLLLNPEEWEKAFNNALNVLWLSWGGLATLDKTNPQFHAYYTGEDSLSYHQGDSWFWINNIAAIAMHRLNHEKYAPYIQKIFEASAKDLLQGGIPGNASELSSAKEFDPDGSLVQAWSAATFIELYQELFTH